MKKFYLLTILLLTSRITDNYTTYQYMPNLENELNPIVSIFEKGWTTLLIVQLLIIVGFIYCTWIYCTKKLPLPIIKDKALTFKEFISLFNYNDKNSFNKIFYKLPNNKSTIIYIIGYAGTISLTILSYILALSTTFLIFSDSYRNFYRTFKIPLVFLILFILLFLTLLTNFYRQAYQNYLANQ